MPAVSKQQFRMMAAICSGMMKPRDGITKEMACEFMSKTKDVAHLPERKTKRKFFPVSSGL